MCFGRMTGSKLYRITVKSDCLGGLMPYIALNCDIRNYIVLYAKDRPKGVSLIAGIFSIIESRFAKLMFFFELFLC